ncbi:HYR-like domain-containing protein, partial [Flavobacterium sp. XGLA_31]|uniref:HYR-like domain-containing protein n=1 Tax=Flavobacterium sp. XGLA_31 TaxID=3447666 RepID=UPI003F30C2E6
AALATAQAAFPVATDNCDGDVTNIVKTSGEFVANEGCANAGTYTNTWTVADACGNTSAVFTQVITVQDTTAPTWTTAAGSLDATVECSDATALATAQAAFPVASDLCDADVTNIVKTSGEFVANEGCANAGTYTNTWTVADA